MGGGRATDGLCHGPPLWPPQLSTHHSTPIDSPTATTHRMHNWHGFSRPRVAGRLMQKSTLSCKYLILKGHEHYK
jgi:hypothetical protein